jgi:hypothetical protein
MTVRSRATVVASIAVLLVGGTWTGLSIASGVSSAAERQAALKVNPLSVVVKDAGVASFPNQQVFTVAPGDVTDGEASCPKDSRQGNTLSSWFVVGGGYHMYGVDGAAVASATAAYPDIKSESYKVVVANPKLAASTVRFYVEANCIDVKEGPIGT